MQWSLRDRTAVEPPGISRRLTAKLERAFPWAAATVCLSIAAVFLHTLAIWPGAVLLSQVARGEGARQLLVGVIHDEMYARLILSMLGNIQPAGLARGWGPSVVFTAGSSAVGVQAVQVAINVAMVLAGTVAVLAFRRGALVAAGAICLACGVGAELRLSWSAGSGGEMALSMVATKLFGLKGGLYDQALSHGWLLSPAVNVLLLLLASGVGLALAKLASLVHRKSSLTAIGGKAGFSYGAFLALLLGATSPAVVFQESAVPALPARSAQAPLQAAMANWPSVVTVQPLPDGKGWAYVVNGQRESFRGMGYNAITTGETPEQRAAQFDRDFSAISGTGANTLVGWSEREFDQLLMRKAAEHGLGVLLPFELGPYQVLSAPDTQYEDPQVRQQVMSRIESRVEEYRNDPALRMWGLGNEVLHAMAWSRAPQARVDAFATFLIQAADRVHQLDPNHPVIYRDAEDWYATPIIKALAADPKPRPWLIYGMNFFTTRLSQALDNGPTTAMHQPLLISEFGPVGLRPDARPYGYADLWKIIRDHRDTVLGGSAYVWTTAGPEPLDRNFGLTSAGGQPVDGSVAELTALYSAAEKLDGTALPG